MEDMNPKVYHLTGPDGKVYDSYEKGLLGGYDNHYHGDYYDSKNRSVYGRLDCPAALRALEAPTHASYELHRVFFRNEDDAIAAGFRPCGRCLPEKFAVWKAGKDPRTAPFPEEYYASIKDIV